MHPPLERPHPDCQDAIEALRKCHAENSKVFFWRCNQVKADLDHCFKMEKKRLLKELNKDYEKTRSREDDLMKEALGQTMSFQEYLEKDKNYNKVRKENSGK
jgi:COX assembly mitochondrial protein 2